MGDLRMRTALTRFLRICKRGLSADARNDLHWYHHGRPKRVSAKALFEEYAWALLVAGIARRSADTWADRTDFWETFTLSRCRRYPAAHLLRKVRVSANNRMGRKLKAIHALGRSLYGLNPRQVADRFLGGELRTSRLAEQHALMLVEKLPFIRQTSGRFIIRNLGGELIKDDRYLNGISRYFGCSEDDFKAVGRSLGWKLGKVDLVVWCYCEQEIRSTRRIQRHLDALDLWRRSRAAG